MAVRIRPCIGADIAEVQALLAQTWHATYDGWLGPDAVRRITQRWHASELLLQQLGSGDRAFLIAEAEGRIAGTGFAHVVAPSLPVEIGRLYVLPSHQGRGIGSSLLKALMAELATPHGWDVEVEPRNLAALRFYARHGFVVAGAGADGGGSGGLPHVRLHLPGPSDACGGGTSRPTV